MDWNKVHRVAIYPAIGIARVGNSPEEYFVGPTIPGQHPSDPDDFRDPEKRIKRQGARFSVFGLDKDGAVLGEIDACDDVSVEWRVEIANKKASWYNFDIALDIPAAAGEYDTNGKATPGGLPVLSQMRNRDYEGAERKKLMIEPSARQITGTDAEAVPFDDGEIDGKSVYLGELRTDSQGRLIFLGGLGESDSFNGTALTTFANNDGWHDDTSDGPVDATVTRNGQTFEAEGAWVVTTPPNFAVGVQAFSTGYDLLLDVAAKLHPSMKSARPEFYRDIYPMLKHLSVNQWVNAGVSREFGWGSAYDFDHAALIERASDPSPVSRPFRQIVLESFRNPNYQAMEALGWPPLYGDAVTFKVNSEDPRAWFAVTELQYGYLEQWAKGEFDVETPRPVPKTWDDMSPQEQANGLTEAALEETLGGPFHPGCEFTWPMRHALTYSKDTPFRIKRRNESKEDYGVAISEKIVLAEGGPLDGSSPGDITRWMAVPWQSDTSSCLSSYRAFLGEYLPTFWPARVPNDVLTEEDYATIKSDVSDEEKIKAFSPDRRKKWLRGYIYNDEGEVIGGSSISDRMKGVVKFTKEWAKIGIVLKRDLEADPNLFPKEVWVETGRQLKETDLRDSDGRPEVCSKNPAWMDEPPQSLR